MARPTAKPLQINCPPCDLRAAARGTWSRARARGLGLVETMCTLCIASLLMGGALPMLEDMVASQRLLAQANLLMTDLHLARSEAQTNNQNVRLSVNVATSGSTCYVIHTGGLNACNCNGAGKTQCDVGATVLRVVEQTNGIRLDTLSRPLTFDASNGTVTPTATLRMTDREGRAVNQVINLMGRVRTCSPNARIAGVRRC